MCTSRRRSGPILLTSWRACRRVAARWCQSAGTGTAEHWVEVPVPETVVLAHGSVASAGARSLRGEGSTGGWPAHAVPSGTPWRDSPPAQGGKEKLCTAAIPEIQEPILDKTTVDVLVITQPEFQQSVPQFQFFDRVLDIPVRDRYAQCQTVQKRGDSTGAVLGEVAYTPVDVSTTGSRSSAENCLEVPWSPFL